MSVPDERAGERAPEGAPSTPAIPARALGLHDVAALAEADEFHRYELQQGGLIVLPPPDLSHGKILTKLTGFLLRRWSDEQVVQGGGVRIAEDTGRIPDLLVSRRKLPDKPWADPDDLLLVVEVVSPSTRVADRLVKPSEYARAGIPAYWRVERASGVPTAHLYTLGSGEHGEPAYVGHREEPLERLVAGEPPSDADFEIDPTRHPTDH